MLFNFLRDIKKYMYAYNISKLYWKFEKLCDIIIMKFCEKEKDKICFENIRLLSKIFLVKSLLSEYLEVSADLKWKLCFKCIYTK